MPIEGQCDSDAALQMDILQAQTVKKLSANAADTGYVGSIPELGRSLEKWEGNGNPLQCSCLENPEDEEAW